MVFDGGSREFRRNDYAVSSPSLGIQIPNKGRKDASLATGDRGTSSPRNMTVAFLRRRVASVEPAVRKPMNPHRNALSRCGGWNRP